MHPVGSLEDYFSLFRQNIIGCEQLFESPFGRKRILYADWTASGRAYGPIEARIQDEILPFLANTQTETTITGRMMSRAYEEAKTIVKDHVHAKEDDVLVFCGSGMTAAVNKLQRIMGLRLPERVMDYVECLRLDEASRPLVLVTHMEHHSNHISWLETIATVEMIRPCENGNVDLEHLRQLLEQYKDRKNKIAAITACSNVTGIETPYHDIASVMHESGVFCFVDFAFSAPYVSIDMHPEAGSGLPGDPGRPGDSRRLGDADLDAIYFSCHKFLGGPGTPGVLIFNRRLYKNRVPDQPGGGTMLYSNPWKVHEYVAGIETREDGGTPPILQGIKAALCIRLKEEMGIDNIWQREKEMLDIVFPRLAAIPRITLLAPNNCERLGILSFLVDKAPHDTVVQHLNDRYGIQTRGGCSCAGPYGHHLLHIDPQRSLAIREKLLAGNTQRKPGSVRLSLHPTMPDRDIEFILDAIVTALTDLPIFS